MDTQEEEKKPKVLASIMQSMPDEWKQDLFSFGKGASLTLERRVARCEVRLGQESYNKLCSVRRWIEFHTWYCEDQQIPLYPVTTDVLIDQVEEYIELAKRGAEERRLKREARGVEDAASERGGLTAGIPIYYAMHTAREVLGLDVATTKEVKRAASAPPAMPAVRPMLTIENLIRFEKGSTMAAELTEFERAYCGGLGLTTNACTRVKDMQRTAKIEFETCTIHGTQVTVACGVPPKSKALSRLKMKALEWRAPMVAIGGRMLDLQPLLDSMPECTDGCVFRDFVVPKGKKHVITNATAWADRAAPHDTVVRSAQHLLYKLGLGAKEARAVRGHDARHVLPNVARALALPKQLREHIGNWRITPVAANDQGDRVALREAVRRAREQATRQGALQSCADRYSCEIGADVMADEARTTCLLAMQHAVQVWDNEIGERPAGQRQQLQAIASMAHSSAPSWAEPADDD